MMKREAVFSKDLRNKRITVVRAFDAPLDIVWKAWTDSAVLDQWWAPKPYQAKTKTMDFRAGGRWIYLMKGPEGDAAWCLVEFKTVEPLRNFSSSVAFCDEQGIKNREMPIMEWLNEFNQAGDVTTVTVEISFAEEADMQKIVDMGFEQGFAMGLGNLEEWLAAHVPA